MPSNIRLKRIQEQIQKVLTEILENRVNDPRVEGVYITDVTIDRELDYANIYVSSNLKTEFEKVRLLTITI